MISVKYEEAEKTLCRHVIDVSKITDLYCSVEREPIERYSVFSLPRINSAPVVIVS